MTDLTAYEKKKLENTRHSSYQFIKKHRKLKKSNLWRMLDACNHPFYAIGIVMEEMKHDDNIEVVPILKVIDYEIIYKGE